MSSFDNNTTETISPVATIYRDHKISSTYISLINYKDSISGQDITWSAEGDALGYVFVRDLKSGEVIQQINPLDKIELEKDDIEKNKEDDDEDDEDDEDDDDPAVEHILSYYNKNNQVILYISRNGNLSSYILASFQESNENKEKNNNQPIILSPLSSYYFNGINSLSIHTSLRYLAVSDDDSLTYIIPFDELGNLNIDLNNKSNQIINKNIVKNNPKIKILKTIHTSILGSLAFSPHPSKLSLYGGGFDSILGAWEDLLVKNQTSQRLIQNISEEYEQLNKKNKKSSNDEENQAASNQIINPPFVQMIKFIKGSSYFGLGLGDGSIRILSTKDLKTVAFQHGHNGMINSFDVVDDIIITSSIDRYIKLWQFIKKEINLNPSASNNKKKNNNNKNIITTYELNLLNEFNHQQKINSIIAYKNNNNLIILVSDTTKNITKYDILI